MKLFTRIIEAVRNAASRVFTVKPAARASLAETYEHPCAGAHALPVEEPASRRELIRLTPDQYEALARKLVPPVVTAQTTALQAGYQPGVQHALATLRDGYVMAAKR